VNMNHRKISCAALILGLAVQFVFAADPNAPANPFGPKTPPSPTVLPDAVTQTIKTAYPSATLGSFLLNMDRGVPVYFVTLTGDKTVSSAEVTALGVLMQGNLKLDQKDVPPAVAGAAAAQAASTTAPGDKVEFFSADQLSLRAEFSPKDYASGGKHSLVPLATPVTVYDVTFTKAGIKGVVRLDAAGKIVDPINWMKRASADVPAGKLVIRANLGCNIDYTDASGIVWSADQKYSKENKWGATDGRPNFRLGLKVLGTDAPFIYDSERDKEGAYRFDVPNGTYTVRIHFCETWEGAKQPNLREFGIKIQGTKVVDKMDISGAAGGWMIPLVKEFKDIKVTDGKLVVEPFSNNGRDQHPSVEAYEVYAQ